VLIIRKKSKENLHLLKDFLKIQNYVKLTIKIISFFNLKICTYIYIYGQGMWRVWGRIEVCIGCWWESLRETDHRGYQDVDGRIILRWIFRKLEGVVLTGWSWLRIGTDGGHLWVR
jgi:hypothetical protein